MNNQKSMNWTQTLLIGTFILFLSNIISAQKIWTEPANFKVDSTVTIYFDLKKSIKGKGLIGMDSVYFWSTHPTFPGDSLMGNFRNSAPPALMKKEGDDVWSYTLIPTVFYNLDSATFANSEWWVQAKAKDAGTFQMNNPMLSDYVGLVRQPVVDLQNPNAFKRGQRQRQYIINLLDASTQVLPDPEKQINLDSAMVLFDRGGFYYFDYLEDDTFLTGPFWQYLNVRNPDTVAHSHYLLASMFGMTWDSLTVYARDNIGNIDTSYTGNLVPLQKKDVQDWRGYFKVELDPGESKQLFIHLLKYDSRENIPRAEFMFEAMYDAIEKTEAKLKIQAYVMIAILGFAVVFYLIWFLMSGSKELGYHSLLWFGFLLSILIPSPLGSYFVINDIYPLVTNWLSLAMAWLLVSSVILWGLLGFTTYFLEFKKYAPGALKWVKILAILPLFLFLVGGIHSIWPNLIPYDHYKWEGFFYFPSTNIRSVILAIGFIFMAIMGFSILWKGFRPALFYLISFVPLTISATLVSLSNLRMAFNGNAIGLPDNLNIANNISMIIALLLFGLAMGYKQRKLEKDHAAAREELLKAKEKALKEEALAREHEISLREKELSLQEERSKKEQMKEMEELRNRFFTNITHEFRTPLTVIMGMGENIKGNKTEKKLILRNSQNLLQLINQLLDLSKLEKGSLPLRMKQADIVSFARFLTESFYSMAEGKGVRLSFYSEEEQILMDFDEEKIQYIIYNLLSNGIKYTDKGGKVILVLSKMEDQLKITVQDTGKGIPEDEIPHIFDRFYQARSTNNETQGTGIGLAYTKEIIHLLDGTIEVKSIPDKGTTFTCILPITNNAAFEEIIMPMVQTNEEDPQSEPSISPALVGLEEKPIILIVEDNPDVITYIQTILGGLYELKIARDGLQGEEMAKEFVPDLIVSDVMMPGKTGYELCDAIKSDVKTSHIPLILLTAKATQDDKLEGLTYGADAYLLKPFDKRELLVRIEKLIESRKALQQLYASGEKKNNGTQAEKQDQEFDFVIQLREAIDKEISNEQLSIPELASYMNMSQIQLYRKLKALTGRTPSQFVRLHRLEKGKQMLSNPELTIAEIAYQVGFSDPNYFSRTFHDAYGRPPSDFR